MNFTRCTNWSPWKLVVLLVYYIRIDKNKNYNSLIPKSLVLVCPPGTDVILTSVETNWSYVHKRGNTVGDDTTLSHSEVRFTSMFINFRRLYKRGWRKGKIWFVWIKQVIDILKKRSGKSRRRLKTVLFSRVNEFITDGHVWYYPYHSGSRHDSSVVAVNKTVR